jgi:phospholipase/lecithinase/hemolysin
VNTNKRLVLSTLSSLVLAALLASCGGGGDSGSSSTNNHVNTVVSFGDSLSDVGTYAPAKVMTAGVKFTTNPADMWTEVVAKAYGAQLQPFSFVRFNKDYATDGDLSMSVTQTSAGTSYAQGSARVSSMSISLSSGASAPSASPLIPGNTAYGAINVAPAGAGDVIVGYSYNGATPFAAKSGVPTALTAVSVKDQISNYLNTHGDQFSDDQLVLIQGGANDLFVALSTYKATGRIAPDPNYCGGATLPYVTYNPVDPSTDNIVTCAAKEMALQLKRLVDKGATKILYSNLPDVGATPEFVLYAMADPVNGAATKAFVTQLSGAYNAVVLGALKALGIEDKVKIFDTWAFFANTLANPPAGTVSMPNAKVACLGPASSGSTTGVTSLGCASAASGGSGFVSADAPTTYIFADGVHPSQLGHKLWGDAAASLALSAFPR